MTICAASSARMVVNTSLRARRTKLIASRVGEPKSVRDKYLTFDYSITPSSRCTSTTSGMAVTSPCTQAFIAAPIGYSQSNSGEKLDYFRLALCSTLLTCTLGIVCATTSPDTDHGTTGTNSKLSGGGGNGGNHRGPFKSFSPIVGGQEVADEDVKKMEEEAIQSPYLVSEGAIQGVRWTMEDAYSVENGGRFVAVFDGHGGSAVSSTLRSRLHSLYRTILSTKHWEERDDFDGKEKRTPSIASHVAALRGALEQVEEDVLEDDRLIYQGSTAVAVVLHVGEDGRKTLLSANVGDSRAILSRKGKAIDLTRDHKPNDERERARIRAQGEEVEWDPYGEVYRVRDLSLSRAIGDKFAKPVVSSEAEIKHFPVVDSDDEFILLASDGLWDTMSSQEVIDFIRKILCDSSDNENETAKKRLSMANVVANEALERGSADNICVLIVWLQDQSANFPSP